MKDPVIFGLHAVEAALKNDTASVKTVWLLQSRQDRRIQGVLALAKQHQVPTHFLSKREFDKRYPDCQHQGVVAITKGQKTYNEQDIADILAKTSKPPFILILDGVTDPHNLGACLRSADAVGVDCVIIPKDNSVGLTPVVRKVACGAAETVPLVQVTNLARTMSDLQQRGVWIYGAAGEATESLYQHELDGAVCIAMGSESKGLRRLTREHCDHLLSIPMQGTVESLNVSVATGICLFEVARQRLG